MMQARRRGAATRGSTRTRRLGGASTCVAALSTVVLATGCGSSAAKPSTGSTPSTSSASTGASGSTVVTAVATINAWGSILAQLGGTHVHETSIITNPDTDPHDYEPTPADGRTIATAQLFVENSIGYDVWAAKALAANPDPNRTVINVGDLVGVADGGNPHRWYSPTDVEKVADTITADLKQIDPADAAYFDTERQTFETQGLAQYHQLIDEIKTKYAGTPVGASESIFAPLSDALGLDLLTPPSFLKAISEGTDPSAADKSTIDAQINGKQIKVYVFNSQNSTPDVSEQVKAARAHDIPVTTITETLSPATASFQDWQVSQLQALATALHQATGK
ncbi:MAG TPA: zinc ABC transporter substrate-binding protein [Mycobacteriales bacterium]|nr:zinc ABC transporter substrate-binding protein [Mycobacteriales bacterium]